MLVAEICAPHSKCHASECTALKYWDAAIDCSSCSNVGSIQRQRFLLSQSICADTVALSSPLRVLNLSIDTHILSVAQPCAGIDVPMIECFLPFKTCYRAPEVFLSSYRRFMFCKKKKKVLSRTFFKKETFVIDLALIPTPAPLVTFELNVLSSKKDVIEPEACV